MKKSTIMFFTLLLILIGCVPTLAFVCDLPVKRFSLKTAVSKAKAKADVVFSGKVIEIGDSTVKFSVEDLWKGAPMREIVMRNDAGGAIVSDCAYRFVLGERYLVYASASGDGLHTHKCSRTTVLESARADVEVLEKMKAKKAEKRTASLSPKQSLTSHSR